MMTGKEYVSTKGEQRQMVFKHWWKTDDPAWVAQRKQEWKIIKANAYREEGAERLKRYAHFYVYGDVLPRIYMGAELDGVIDSPDRFFMTPYETPEQIRQLFQSFSFNERKKTLLEFLVRTDRFYRGLPADLARHDIRLFIQEIQGDRFGPWEILDDFGRPEIVATKRPGVRSGQYTGMCLQWLRGEIDGGYYYVVDAIEYFLGSLYAREQTEDSDLEFVQKQVSELVSLVMADKDKPLEVYKRLLIVNLYEAFTREQVPLYVKQALRDCI